MFGTVLTTFYTLILAYLLLRSASMPFVDRHIPRWTLVLIGTALWISFYLGRVVGHGGEGPLAAVLEHLGMSALGVVFILFVAMLAADLVTGFGFLLRKLAPSVRGWALAVGLLLSAFALVQGHRAPAIVRHEVVLEGLGADLDGTVLVALSDTHIGSLLGKGWLEARVGQVVGLEPDLVALVGDITEGHGGLPSETGKALQKLKAPMGVYFVSGNHEGHGDERANGKVLEEAGFHRLDGTWMEIRPGLVLAGVGDLTSHRRRQKGGDPVGEALSGRPQGGTVLLSHSPLQAERAAGAGAGLMISGHTHGGQIWPFGYLVRRRYPLLAGRYEVDGMPVVVTRGAGTWGPRMRLFRRGEILHLTLRSPSIIRGGAGR